MNGNVNNTGSTSALKLLNANTDSFMNISSKLTQRIINDHVSET